MQLLGSFNRLAANVTRCLPVLAGVALALGAGPASAKERKQVCEKAATPSLYQSTWDPPFCSALSGKIQSIAQSYMENELAAETGVSSRTQSKIASLINDLQGQSLVVGSKAFFGKGDAANAMASAARTDHSGSKGSSAQRVGTIYFPLDIGSGGTKKELDEQYATRKYRVETVAIQFSCSASDETKTCTVKSIALGSDKGKYRNVCNHLAGVQVATRGKPSKVGGALGSVYAGTAVSSGGRPLRMPQAGDIAYADYKPPWRGPERFVQPNGSSGKVLGKYNMILGKATEFGGAGDKGVKRNEKGSMSESDGNLRNAKGYFCAIRADFGQHNENQRAWKGQKLLVVNPATGRSIVCTLDDWGPSPTKRHARDAFIDLSPAAVTALATPVGAAIDPSPHYRGRSLDQVGVSFASEGTQAGVVQ